MYALTGTGKGLRYRVPVREKGVMDRKQDRKDRWEPNWLLLADRGRNGRTFKKWPKLLLQNRLDIYREMHYTFLYTKYLKIFITFSTQNEQIIDL